MKKLSLPKTLLYKLKWKQNLEAQLLTLSEAFELAFLLGSKIDLEKIDPQSDAIDFIGSLIEKLSPREYLDCVMLLTREDEETIKAHVSVEILAVLIEGLKKNRVVTLLGFLRSLNL